MFYIHVRLEDTLISAHRGADGKWAGTVLDNFTNAVEVIDWTDQQMGAVLALGVGGDSWNVDHESPDVLRDELYKVADTAIADFCPDCRPIP